MSAPRIGRHRLIALETHDHCGAHIGHHHGSTSGRLRFALVLTAIILAVEIAGGVLSNSLALLSDAGHVFTDVIALALAWFAARQAERPATETKTFGFHRAGILAALANAVTLVLIAALILWEAQERLRAPEPVHSELMLAVAFVGLLVNLFVARHLQGHDKANLNVKSAMWHVLGDALASAAVIAGGIVIWLTGWQVVDPMLSVFIALIIAFGAWGIIRETVNILMEGVPKGLDLDRLLSDMRGVPGVKDVHDMHVWSLATGLNALSCHVLVDDQALSENENILRGINDVLGDRHGINHTTLQFEHCECGLVCPLCDNRLVCPMPGSTPLTGAGGAGYGKRGV